ncbi:hypothetical protein [Bacillus sp. EAC]|uniref:hypothetical protein n=1 Tax=Bacillus sp. EAC TaxID=1978338 RepID=UPI000B44F162|nr:hypothetical protein [Bacillus sp. EAC]
MTGLIFLCFVLFLVLCVWNIYLTMQLSRYKEIEKSLFAIKQETEDVLYSFMEEWKEENDEFLNKLSNNSNNNKQAKKSTVKTDSIPESNLPQQNRIDFVEKDSEIDYSDLLLNEKVHNEQKSNEQIPIFSNEIKTFASENRLMTDSTENILEEILFLKKDGFTIDEIAKKLDKGKTEVELMLKLRQ